MSEAGSVRAAGGVLHVAGTLGFSTVDSLWVESAPLFRGISGRFELDVSGVERIDSAGVALLVEWLRLARERGAEMTIRGAPPAMKDLIGLADLQDLLPVASFR